MIKGLPATICPGRVLKVLQKGSLVFIQKIGINGVQYFPGWFKPEFQDESPGQIKLLESKDTFRGDREELLRSIHHHSIFSLSGDVLKGSAKMKNRR